MPNCSHWYYSAKECQIREKQINHPDDFIHNIYILLKIAIKRSTVMTHWYLVFIRTWKLEVVVQISKSVIYRSVYLPNARQQGFKTPSVLCTPVWTVEGDSNILQIQTTAKSTIRPVFAYICKLLAFEPLTDLRKLEFLI